MQQVTIRVQRQNDSSERLLNVRDLVIAGWTGRDKKAVEKHIAELEALGVKRPPHTPVFYRVSSARITCAPVIDVIGDHSSGEVEFVLTVLDGEVLVGIGSDHTDRKLETVGVTIAKQLCDKPIGATFWPLREAEDHWERLILRSRVTINGVEHIYQEGSLAELLPPTELIRKFADTGRLEEGAVLFAGTLAVHGGVRPAQRFAGEIEDPVRNRRISLAYEVRVLPDAG